jgi:hypothetical protein
VRNRTRPGHGPELRMGRSRDLSAGPPRGGWQVQFPGGALFPSSLCERKLRFTSTAWTEGSVQFFADSLRIVRGLLACNLHHQLCALLELHILSRSYQDRVVFALGSSIPEPQTRHVVNAVLLTSKQ